MWWLVFLQFTVVKALEPGIQVTEDNLHGLLSAPERALLLGTSSDVRDTPEKNIAIVHPIVYHNSNKLLARKRRSILTQTREQYIHNDAENDHRVVLEATKPFGKTFDLRLKPSPPLLDPNVVFLSRWANKTTVIPHDFIERDCYFRGDRAALSLCDGIRGIITSEDNHFYTIHPLPKRFQESNKIPHVIVRRSMPKVSNSSSKFIHKTYDKDMKQHNENITEWSKHHRRKDNNDSEKNRNDTNTAFKSIQNNLANRNISNSESKIHQMSNTNNHFDVKKVISQQDSDLFINNENKIDDTIETNLSKNNLLNYIKNIFITGDSFLNTKTADDILIRNSSREYNTINHNNVRFNSNNSHTLRNVFEGDAVQNNFIVSEHKDMFRDQYNSIREPQISFRNEKMNLKRGKRGKRAAPATGVPVHVETAVFVDKDLFQHMEANYPSDTEREIVRFVLAMINAVQLLYHDPSLGRPVNFALKRLEVLHDDASATAPGFGPLRRSHDIDRFLGAFCSWQRARNPPRDTDPAHWDHALILTGLDLYVVSKRGKISSQVVGLAPVAGMCTATSSCTVNEGRHFESVYVVAHEIGHNLGMRHDGPLADNDCDPSSFIMSPTLGSGKITWSGCSKRYLQMFLETTQSQCLLDHGSSAGQLDHSAEGALPGERFDADQQCMLKYGRGSKHSLHQPLDDICRDLHCQRDRYTWTSHPALEGTTCGPNMWCRGGRCVGRSNLALRAYSGTSSSSTKVHGGWSTWQTISDCASGCLYGEEGRLRAGSTGVVLAARRCNTPRPENGGRRCEGPTRRYQACNAMQCLNVPRMTISEFADQICGRAREVDTDLTGSGLQRLSSDPEEACMVWCHKRGGGSKTRGWTFPDGTVCQKRQRRFGKPTYCINGRCQEFSCQNRNEDVEFLTLPELCPDTSWRNNPRRRDSSVTVRWSSASGCHSHCMAPGTGIRLVITKNKPQRSSIQLCQPDKNSCGRLKTPFQHATAVCTKYKERVRRLSGLGMQISSALEDPDRPCRVACQDENVSHRFYLVNGEEGWFPFGTDCTRGSTEKRAYCISGKCLEFGADDTPLSESEFTLPLLSRTKRSLQRNITRVMATLQQHELDQIVSRLNLTFTDSTISHARPIDQQQNFEIDLNNPIHIPMEFPMDVFPHNYYRDYYNNVYV